LLLPEDAVRDQGLPQPVSGAAAVGSAAP